MMIADIIGGIIKLIKTLVDTFRKK
ncbi:Orf-X peptide [Staphylococcus lugdunensis N920143]|nr:Orf-X peptide [Staphylococcus lugdunensis N920143]